jgi:hypothetical protein
VLQIVQRLVVGRQVVQRRQVPDGEHDAPDRERHQGADEEREQRPERTQVSELAQGRARKEEVEHRAGEAEQHQRDGCVPDQDVLEHVRGEEVALADRIEWRAEGEHEQREADAERDGAADGGVILAAPPA